MTYSMADGATVSVGTVVRRARTALSARSVRQSPEHADKAVRAPIRHGALSNPKYICVALLAGATAALLASCSESGKESERPKAENSPVKRGANGEVIVTLDAATRTRIGLKVDIPAAAQWRSEIKGYGRALDPAPIAALITDLVSAHLTTRVSQQELER